jgi:hypothetical protein
MATDAAGQFSKSDRSVMRQLERLEARFVERIRYEGYSPEISPPKVVLGDPPSFGTYEPGPNTIYIAAWPRLTAEEQHYFADIAKGIGHGATARGVFENGTHRWVFIHELGHWWQACRHVPVGEKDTSYALEKGADRIAMAFWRAENPRFMAGMIEGFKSVQASIPNPVPAGQNKAEYFDKNFQQFVDAGTYPWYQSDMIVDLAAENPLPSLQRALSQPVFP